MSVHPPKYISSLDGLGVNTTKQLRLINQNWAIGVETWTEVQQPWAQEDTVIANNGYKWVTDWQVGRPFIITKFLNELDQLVGIYCDISRPVERVKGGFAFIDMYLDVWLVPGQEPIILDQDELEEAVEADYIPQADADEAMQIALKVVENLKVNPEQVLSFGM